MWQSILKAANQAEAIIDKWVRRVKRRIYRHTDVSIIPYIGHGTPTHLRLRGRILENHRILPANDADSAWRNFRSVMSRFNSDELPFVELSARFHEQVKTIRTDDEGYYYLEIELDAPLEGIWHEVELNFDDGRRQASAIANVMIPPKDAQFGIISDMDDTVLRSNVTNRIKLLATTFFKNAHTRLPFSGVAEFYRALQVGTIQSFNPIYYVSNSPYNLYDMLEEFFELRGIPKGPIFLRDFGLTDRLVGANRHHKAAQITRILELHPQLPFILIGDSGEHDPDIYAEIVRQFPKRILAIYIRDVRPHEQGKYHARAMAAAERVKELGSEMLLVPDTLHAAQHAAEKGFIVPESLSTIETAVKEDTPTNPLEAMLDEGL